MVLKMPARLRNLILLFLILSLGYACGPTGASPFTPTTANTYPVDKSLREYYEDLGGADLLGPAISPIFKHANQQCQYLVNALMCYNPLATGVERFSLQPLGLSLGVHDDPEPMAASDLPFVDGYFVYEDFYRLYQQLNGPINVGRPLTRVRYNYEQQRIEQYFEKLGFAHRFNDPPGVVSLLPYGAYFCGENCRYQLNPQAHFIPSNQTAITSPFDRLLERMGGIEVFGRPLTQPYTAADGSLEQVFENVAVFAPPDNPVGMRLRPLARWLNMRTTPPGPQQYDLKDNVVFYPVDGDLGYHVPVMFDRFIAQHGGQEISGPPIAEAMIYPEDNVARQCFENYCLDYYPGAAETLRTRLAPLGKRYLDSLEPGAVETQSLPQPALTLQVSEEKPQLPASEPQVIHFLVRHNSDGQPAVGAEVSLELTLPEGSKFHYAAVSDSQGLGSIAIPPMPKLENGTLVIYRVCVNLPEHAPVCADDSYLIWNLQ